MLSLEDMLALTESIIDGNTKISELTMEEIKTINQYLEDLDNIKQDIWLIGKERRF